MACSVLLPMAVWTSRIWIFGSSAVF